MTYNLRPLHLRLANGVAETKGYNGAGMNPWRTAKKVTRPGQREAGKVELVEGVMVWTKTPGQAKRQAVKVQKRDGVWSYPNVGGSTKAKGLDKDTPAVVDNNAEIGGCYEWTQEDRNTAAEQNQRTLAATGCETAEPWQTTATEALPSGLRTKDRLEGAGGATDKQWVGQLKTPVTAQAKPMAHNDEGWYEVERVEGFEPATTEERDAALAEQIEVHGNGYRVRHARQCKAWETKQMSWKQLTNVVRGATSWISLDDKPEGTDNVEPAWTPTTADRMTELAEAAESYENQQLMRRILGRMTDKQREAIEAKAMGKTLTGAQRFNLLAARKKVK